MFADGAILSAFWVVDSLLAGTANATTMAGKMVRLNFHNPGRVLRLNQSRLPSI